MKTPFPFISLLFFSCGLLAASAQALPETITATKDLALTVHAAEITEESGFRMLRVHCEWQGADPREQFKLTKPVLIGTEHPESKSGHTWNVLLPLTAAKNGGIPFDLDIKNPPKGINQFTIRLPLIPKDPQAEVVNIDISLPAGSIPVSRRE